MLLRDLLIKDIRISIGQFGAMIAIAGASNTLLLAVINSAASHIDEGSPQYLSFALFVLWMGFFVYSQRYVVLKTSAKIEEIVHRCREQLISKLTHCELREVEQIGRGRIFSAISADTQTISQTASGLIMAIQAATLVFFGSIYLGTLSMVSLFLSATGISIIAWLYLSRMRSIEQDLHQAGEKEAELHDLVSGLLKGFKEIKLSSQRALDALADAVQTSQQTARFNTQAQQSMGAAFVFGQASIFLLLGMLVFATPIFGKLYADSVTASMTTVIFLVGPISTLALTTPQFATARVAIQNLIRLEKVLTPATETPTPAHARPAPDNTMARLDTLSLRRVLFSYEADGSRFDLGPIDLTVKAGETIFITGGNGSGKSTLIKLLTGLYTPDSGALLVNDVPVTAGNAQAFRNRFCAVFTDFYLFRKFFRIEDFTLDEAEQWLHDMELSGKTAVSHEGFSTIDLSHGQRKRMALINALLEHKPIVILDEWAADQDPHFRRIFYEELLPRLKAAGKTIIAVTHDDRYFKYADRRLHMEEGQLSEPQESVSNG